MYSNKFVACLVVNGKIVREVGEEVYLPFGSEYAIRLKNLDTRRAVVSISVDGEDATGGTQLVIGANEETDFKGFLDAANNVAHNRFRFIEKTDKISEHRGDRSDDGLIRIEFQFEEPPYVPTYRPKIKKTKGWPDYDRPSPMWGGGVLRGSSLGGPAYDSSGEISCNAAGCDNLKSAVDMGFASASPTLDSVDLDNDQGITVAGSVVNQKFGTTHVGYLDPTKYSIVFHLKGKKSDGKEVVTPLLTRAKVTCPSCGTKNHSGNKFCPECSTCLV